VGVERWAQGEDGDLVRLVFEGATDGDGLGSISEQEWWPPLGLVAVEAPGAEKGDASEIRVDLQLASWRERLESDLGLFAAEHLRRLVAVHAAVIEVAGKLVVLPGSSFTGKSTLCAAAVAAGHTVWSDEYALVDPSTGRVTGWPRRIKLRGADGGTERVDIGGTSVREMRSVDRLVFVAYDESATVPLDVRSITPGDAAMRVLENTVCAQSRPGDALSAATALARSCGAVAGTRGAADLAVAELWR
jgi:hypothetical protein